MIPSADDTETAEALLIAVLRGEPTRWPFSCDEAARRFLAAAARHGVRSLAARQLRRGILSGAPELVQQALASVALRHAIVEERLAAETRRVLDALAGAGVPSLLMKGAALAYTCYPHPCLRPRTDTDVMVPDGDVATASRVFEALGYEAPNLTRGELLLHQHSFERSDGLGIRHLYDIHWKVAAPQIFANLLPWAELQADARPVPALGEHARAIGDAHALLLACVHRLAHHYDDPSLIWLYDIHLLASRLNLDEDGWQDFGRLTGEMAVASMCARSLGQAHERFGTALPAGLLHALDTQADDSVDSFGRGARQIDVLLSDLKSLPAWRSRVQLLREHVLPPADYIRRLYGVSNPLWLPALYVHRCVGGALRWLQPLR